MGVKGKQLFKFPSVYSHSFNYSIIPLNTDYWEQFKLFHLEDLFKCLLLKVLWKYLNVIKNNNSKNKIVLNNFLYMYYKLWHFNYNYFITILEVVYLNMIIGWNIVFTIKRIYLRIYFCIQWHSFGWEWWWEYMIFRRFHLTLFVIYPFFGYIII